ncbi:MAG TPA: 5'-nucleotidase, lipoprotein e(P4) family [Pyrinomonadaceae bacterium]|nr:5'-nucleotidase, lipoprotein e(P4) family [Pyrinomonadaceae bacterium]
MIWFTNRSAEKGSVIVLLLFGFFVAPLTSSIQAQQRVDNEHQVGGILWTQTSGEWRALAYQAFALARLRLDQDLRANRNRRIRRAVIVDVDETVLDNSPYQAMTVKTRTAYESKSWLAWCEKAEAAAIPGAVEFLRYANSRGVRVFYVTNRRESEKRCTAQNLKKVGFPDVSDETVLVRTDVSSKQPRRDNIARKHRVVLLMGDNLNDFAGIFETSKTIDSRLAATQQNKSNFGTRFIVLPNVMYGAWEEAIYGDPSKLTEEQKAEKRRNALKDF